MGDKLITDFDLTVPDATGTGVLWAARYEAALEDCVNRALGKEIKNITTGLWGAPVSGGQYADTPLNRKVLEAVGFMEVAATPGIWETPVVGTEYKAYDQSMAGAFGGTLLFQMFSGTCIAGANVLIASGIKEVVHTQGHATTTSQANTLASDSYATGGARMYSETVSGALRLYLGQGATETYRVSVWYIKL